MILIASSYMSLILVLSLYSSYIIDFNDKKLSVNNDYPEFNSLNIYKSLYF